VTAVGTDAIEGIVPTAYSLSQNYPNPFNPSTTIQFSVPVRSMVRVEIFNILGQTVSALVNGDYQAGIHRVVWDAHVASGIYFYRITAESVREPGMQFSETRRMLLLR
jgi:hypothetical protein